MMKTAALLSLLGAATAQTPFPAATNDLVVTNMECAHVQGKKHAGPFTYMMHVTVEGAIPGHPVGWLTGASEGAELFPANDDGRVNCPYNTESGLTFHAGMTPETHRADHSGVVTFAYSVDDCNEDGDFYGQAYQMTDASTQCSVSPVVNLGALYGIEFVLKVHGEQAEAAEVDEAKMIKFVLEHMIDGNNNGWKNHEEYVHIDVANAFTPITQFYTVGAAGPAAGAYEPNTAYITMKVHTDALDLNGFTFDNAMKLLHDFRSQFGPNNVIRSNNDFEGIRNVGKAFYQGATVTLHDSTLWRIAAADVV